MNHSITLATEVWTKRAEKHVQLIGPFADAFVKRRSVRMSHPVHDFLFTYYSCSPSKVKQWVPSMDEALEADVTTLEEFPWFNLDWFKLDQGLLVLNRVHLNERIRSLAAFIAELCEGILQRPARFGCFGLHEWAMVYKSTPETIRHSGYRLRLTQEELARFVESQALCCTHYDAYRFFTEEARPLNLFNPLYENRLHMEQGGCLHANMDLYKWASKLWPWIGSDFIAKTFMLALDGRELDMRASPYDLTADGYEPLRIETESGRKQYQKEQQLLAERSTILRLELLNFCKKIS